MNQPARPLPRDFCRCEGVGCPIASHCMRHTWADVNTGDRTPFTHTLMSEDGSCGSYIPDASRIDKGLRE